MPIRYVFRGASAKFPEAYITSFYARPRAPARGGDTAEYARRNTFQEQKIDCQRRTWQYLDLSEHEHIEYLSLFSEPGGAVQNPRVYTDTL